MAEAASNNLRRKVYVETASVDVQILHLAPWNAPRLKIQGPRLRLEKKVVASQFLKDQVSPWIQTHWVVTVFKKIARIANAVQVTIWL